MPFTPFHFGPALLIKSVAPRHFSFQVFVLSQVLIDIEPGLGLLLGWEDLHGPTHTWSGAILIALLTYGLWRLWERYAPPRMLDTPRIGNWIVAVSAIFGTLSHVWLDSQYHVEMARMTPFRLMLYKTGDSATQIEILCIACAILALCIYLLRNLLLWLWLRYRAARPTK